MSNFQRGYGESDIGTGGPTIGPRFAARYAVEDPDRITVDAAKAKAWRAFWQGTLFGLVVGVGLTLALPGRADTISISGSLVSLEPSAVPGELAVVTFQNFQMNGGHDDGSYPLAMPGVVVEVIFAWEQGIWGEDRVTVIPPEGIACIPESCAATVMEGFTGHVVLIDWRGM